MYTMKEENILPRDLHIHTSFSEKDESLAPEQTIELVKKFRYAETMGINDHFEQISDPDKYIQSVKRSCIRTILFLGHHFSE